MICKQCLIDKPLSEFYKHPGTKEGVLHFCKECKRAYARTNRSKEGDKNRYWNNPRRRLNVIYRGLMSRCYNINNNHYKWYGGKGIKVLRHDWKCFYNDMVDDYVKHWNENLHMGNRQTQIDRIDNDGHYCKENCRRVTAKENNEINKLGAKYLLKIL